MATDFTEFGGEAQYTDPDYQWMAANGWKYGWVHPDWARQGGPGPVEPWHFEFMASPAGLA